MANENGQKVRTRFAPSPTGNLHIGGLRTAAYAYAQAKHNGGDFILRIEDTDKKREVEGAVEKMKDIVQTFGLTWDEYYIQSGRAKEGIYKEAALKLVEEGHAFYCQCEAKNAKAEGYSKVLRDPCRDKGLTSGAIKLRVPDNEKVAYHDLVFRKDVTWDTNDVADTTLLKSDGTYPTYHLAVVVDDHAMDITHVFRGHDWLPSTPVHLLVYKFLGFEVPEIGHLTDIQDVSGGKLSKRKGSYSCEALLAEGYLPEAILNFIILLGWAPKDNRELFTLPEFVEAFDLNGLQKSNPVYNIEKLNWFNGQYIRKMEDSVLANKLVEMYGSTYPEDKIRLLAPLVKERMKKLTEFESLAGYVFEEREPLKLTEKCDDHVQHALEAMERVEDWTVDNLNTDLMKVVTDNGYKIGDFFQDLRGAIAGSKVTPPMNETLVIMGRDETIKRLQNVIKKADPESSSG